MNPQTTVTGAFAIIALLLILIPGNSALCRLRVDVDPDVSSFSFSGTNSLTPLNGGQAISAPLVEIASVKKGFIGAFYLNSATLEACPVTQDAWLAALPSFTVSTIASPYLTNNLEIWPPTLNGSTAGFPYTPQKVNLQMNMSVSVTDASTASISASVSLLVSNGDLYTSTPITGTRTDSMAGLNSTAVVAGTLQVKDGTLTVDIPTFPFNLLTKGADTQFFAGGPTYAPLTTVVVQSRLRLNALLTCPRYCGDFGKCVTVSDGTSRCQCECGWAPDVNGVCSVPQGYCSRFGNAGGNGSVTVVYVPAPPSSPAAPLVCPAGPVNASAEDVDTRPLRVALNPDGTCSAGYDVNTATNQCNRCGLGFTGSGCATCQNDSGCQIASGKAGVLCVKNATYLAKSQVKNYTCALTDTATQTLLGNSLRFTCSTLPPSNASSAFAGYGLIVTASSITPSTSPIGRTPYCSLSFRMPTFVPGATARCTGWDCVFGRNSSTVKCGLVQCECPTGCQLTDGTDMRPTFEGVTGGITLACQPPGVDGAAQDCSVSLTGLPIDKVSASCTTSECYDPNAAFELGYVADEKGIKGAVIGDAVIAAIPTMVLGLAAAIAVASLIKALPYMKGVPQGQSLNSGRPSTSSLDVNLRLPPQAVAEAVDRRVSSSDSGAVPLNGAADGVRDCDCDEQGVNHVAVAMNTNGHNAADSINSGSSSVQSGVHASGAHSILPAGFKTSSSRVEDKCDGPDLRFLDIHVHTSHAPVASSSIPAGLERSATSAEDILRTRTASTLHILHGIHGCGRAGQVMGILGPSGSGKSTLLNVLSGQISDGGCWSIQGDIHLGTTPMTHTQLVRVVASVPQHELLLKYLTVEECLRCSAALRIGQQATPQHVYNKVQEVLQELNMTHLRHTMTYRGSQAMLSGGERQRVSIGMELVTDPLVMLLDEPTSGLDSYNALQVLNTLKAVASRGRVVITSLHQPSPVLYNMLDQALLLACGHVVYSGAPGSAHTAFTALGMPCPSDHFIAEHMLEVVGNPDVIHSLIGKITEATFQDGIRSRALPAGAKGAGGVSDWTADAPQPCVPLQVQDVPWMRQFGVLSWRMMTEAVRSPMLVAMHWVFAISIGLIVGFVYFKVPNDTGGAQNRVGSIFFSVNLFAFMSVTAVDLLQLERQVVEREMIRNHYPWWMYMCIKLLLDGVVLRLLPGAMFSALFYWLMGLRDSGQAFATFLFVFCTFNCLCGALALVCACIMSTSGRAVLVLNANLLLSVLFSGFLVNKKSIHWALRWITYLSPFRFAWDALVVNELQPMILTLTAPGLPPVPPIQGRLFLGLLGVDPDALTTNIIVLACYYAIVCMAAMAALLLRLHLLRTGIA